ncbi:MAG: carbohydrate porin [Burkholderiaceae bacterium]
MGILIGDGQLNYRPEKILELYYSAQAYKGAALTIGYQRIVNPAYNADRGPVSIASLRFHTEF